MKTVYLDYAATTPLDERIAPLILREMAHPANASSVHQTGQRARGRLEEARTGLAALLGLPPDQVVFTSSATEANNLALRGFCEATSRPVKILTSQLEHSCIRSTAERLADRGAAELQLMAVGEDGRARLPETTDASLICLMAAQNETGVIQDLEGARRLAENSGALWHCDITQYFGVEPLNVPELGAGLVSFSAHKIYGPQGIGCLAGPGLKRIAPQLTGGPQEGEHRAGTQPVALIEGFVEAAKLAVAERSQRRSHLRALESLLLGRLREAGLPFFHNGGNGARLPGFLNLSFPGFTGADLVIALDARGFSVSAGSACATGVMETSPALAAMFSQDPTRAEGALRITPGKDTPVEAMESFADVLIQLVSRPNKA